MTPTAISFNGFDLQSSTYRTQEIKYRHLAEKRIDSRADVRRGGFDIVDTHFTQKQIEVSGWILSDSKENLRTALDAFKKALKSQEQTLSIEYGSDTINYTATVQSINIPEEHFHITRLPFTIVFLTLPWGTVSQIYDGKTITTTTYTNSIDIKGSYSPFPVISWTVGTVPTPAVSKIKFENKTTGDFIEVSGLNLSSNGQYLEIDCENMTVKENSTNSDFVGVFPSFEPGINVYEVTITGTTFQIFQDFYYYDTYV